MRGEGLTVQGRDVVKLICLSMITLLERVRRLLCLSIGDWMSASSSAPIPGLMYECKNTSSGTLKKQIKV